jgi:hypothetical protein
MQILSTGSVLHASEFIPEDDVDRLFEKLQRREPPAHMIAQIIKRIRQLPAEQIYQPPTLSDKTDGATQGQEH